MMVSMIDSFRKLQSAFLIKIWLQKQSSQELPDWVVFPLSFVRKGNKNSLDCLADLICLFWAVK